MHHGSPSSNRPFICGWFAICRFVNPFISVLMFFFLRLFVGLIGLSVRLSAMMRIKKAFEVFDLDVWVDHKGCREETCGWSLAKMYLLSFLGIPILSRTANMMQTHKIHIKVCIYSHKVAHHKGIHMNSHSDQNSTMMNLLWFIVNFDNYVILNSHSES